MLKKENLRKNFLRVKQMADQNLGRAEKSEVLSEDLQTVEKRVELVKSVIQTTSKKVAASLQSTGPDVEKRLRKLPETSLAHSLIENATLLGNDSVMGNMFHMCGECQSTLAGNSLQYEIDVENKVLNPMAEIIDNELPGISKCKKQLTKLTLDMDSARSRWNQAVKQTQMHGTNMASASAKADTIKEEYEDAVNRMVQARDNLATEMYNFISKEAEHSQKLLTLMETQADYHKKALESIEKILPKMRDALECNPHKPVFGMSLEEHLRVTNRDIALVIEACVLTLLELGMEEEGLFRIAGMASRVKKLKKSFDAGVLDMEEYSLDPHTVAGVLKQYLRELADPLLTYPLYPEFLQAAQLPQDQRLQALWTSIHNLPEANYNNFRYLIKFLALLADKSDVNKMTASNIAIVIGPNLLWSEGDNGPNMLTSGTISNLVESIITHAQWFFPEAIDFHQTLRGTATPRGRQDAKEDEEENIFAEQQSSSEQQYAGRLSGTPSESSATDRQNSKEDSASFHSVSSTDDLTQSSQQGEKEVEFGSYSSFVSQTSNSGQSEEPSSDQETSSGSLTNQQSSGLSSPQINVTMPPSPSLSSDRSPTTPSSSPSAPLAESEQASPRIQRRTTRKPAPPPPPDRPYSIAVTASVAKHMNPQAQTWPRQAPGSVSAPESPHEEVTQPMTTEKAKAPPERPGAPPEKNRTMTLDRHFSHSDRPSVPPPERPKIPPPVVPQHQRSASTGSPANTTQQQNGQDVANKPDSP